MHVNLFVMIYFSQSTLPIYDFVTTDMADISHIHTGDFSKYSSYLPV